MNCGNDWRTTEGGKRNEAANCLRAGTVALVCDRGEMCIRDRIDIADTGIGISEQHQGTIFKRFYREDAVHDVDGIGIGLYLAREIVTLQGGYIRVASEVGKGSTFSVFLPRK